MSGKYGKIVFYLEVSFCLSRLASLALCSRNYPLIHAFTQFLQLAQVNLLGEPIAVLMTLSQANTLDLALETCSVLISLKILTNNKSNLKP